MLLELPFTSQNLSVFRQITEVIGVYGLIHAPFTDEYKRSQNAHSNRVAAFSSILLNTPEHFISKIACRHMVKQLDLVQGTA